jgi:O-antigen/teichoic acid export membrane protein
MSMIGKLMSNSALYMAANVLQRGLSFLLIPLYSRYFTTAEFGAMDMLYQLAVTMALFTSLGLPQGLVRGFYLAGDSGEVMAEDDRRKLLGALVTLLVPIAGLFTAGLILFAEPISRALFQGEGDPNWLRLTAWVYLALVMQQLPLQLYKTQQRSRAFAVWSLAAFLLVAGGNLYFIMALKWGLPGMLWGNLLGVGGTAVALTALLLPQIRLNVQWRRLAPLFAFGLPMLPNLLCRKVLEVANRYMLPHWHGLAQVGLFSMGARVAAIMDILLLVPFLYAWQPFFYSLSANPDAPRIFARVTHYFFLLMLCIFLGLQLLQGPALHFLGHGKFDAAGPVVSFLVLAILFNGLQYCVSAGIHLRKLLVAEMTIMAGAAGLNLLTNLLLIPKYGAAGAAAATALSYFVYMAGTFLLSQRYYPVPYLWRRAAFVFAPAVLAFVGIRHFHHPLAAVAILLAFLCAGPVSDLWRHGELAQAWALAGRRLRRQPPERT